MDEAVGVAEHEYEHAVRIAAFQYLDQLRTVHGDALPWRALARGYVFDGQQIPLIGQAGIWKPRVLELPISISTSPRNPYGDVIGDDGLLLYRTKAAPRIQHLPSLFDANILGVRPDHVVEVRADILEEVDGPMLRHGLQDHHRSKIIVPRAPQERPSAERLEIRYEQFRQAS